MYRTTYHQNGAITVDHEGRRVATLTSRAHLALGRWTARGPFVYCTTPAGHNVATCHVAHFPAAVDAVDTRS